MSVSLSKKNFLSRTLFLVRIVVFARYNWKVEDLPVVLTERSTTIKVEITVFHPDPEGSS